MEVALQLPPKRGIYLGGLHLDWLGYPLNLLSQVTIMESSCPSQIGGGVTKKFHATSILGKSSYLLKSFYFLISSFPLTGSTFKVPSIIPPVYLGVPPSLLGAGERPDQENRQQAK